MRRKKLNELLFARVLSSSEQPPTWPRNNFSQEHYFKANWSHPWNVASFRNSTTHCKLPSPAGSSTKSPVPLFLFTSSLLFSFANFLHLFFFFFFFSPRLREEGKTLKPILQNNFETWHPEGHEAAGRNREGILRVFAAVLNSRRIEFLIRTFVPL